MNTTFKKAALALAVTASLGASGTASAVVVDYSFSGAFTMLGATGALTKNTAASAYVAPWYGQRTAITGTMSFDTDTGMGTGTVTPFLFFGDTPAFTAYATGITFQAIGDGMNGPGTLVLGNMGFDWNGTVGIPLSIVMDAAGLFSTNPAGMTDADIGTVISGVGALPATNGAIAKGINMVLGASPIATTTWNTTSLAGAGMGSNPSGGLPLIADTIGGSPMIAGPFVGFNANFDVLSMTVTNVTAIPVPAAVWLLGSGLLGLVGVARRKKAA